MSAEWDDGTSELLWPAKAFSVRAAKDVYRLC